MLIEVLEPMAAQHALDLVQVEVAGTTKNPILRIYLDTPEGGITLDQLSEAQQWIDVVLDEVDPFQYSYVLEVSSPGIDRPLRRREDFERFAGEEAVVFTKSGQPQKVQGDLQGMDADDVLVGEARIPFSQIKSAHIIGRIDFNERLFEEMEQAEEGEE